MQKWIGAPARHSGVCGFGGGEVLFVDAGVDDARVLLDGCRADIEIRFLSPVGDGLRQIAGHLAGRSGVTRVHLLSHGEAGVLHLAGERIDLAVLAGRQAVLTEIAGSLRHDAEVILYGCSVAAGPQGRAFVGHLEAALGAAVAASGAPVGLSAQGGDWTFRRGDGSAVEPAFAAASRAAYPGLLDPNGPTAGADNLTGTSAADLISALAGNDTVTGLDGNDTLSGGLGADWLIGGDGDDTLYGLGSDTTGSGDGNNIVYGDTGHDLIFGADGRDTLYGGDGNDTLFGLSANDTISSEAGDDLFYGGAGNDTMYGGAGNDTGFGDDGNDFLYMEDGHDVISGGAGNDGMSGGDGNDTIYGGAGNDTAMGSTGDDLLYGGEGNDWLWGQKGNDLAYGGVGSDTVSGDDGEDTLYGEEGDDLFQGHSGKDLIYGGDGNDTMSGMDNEDTLYGGAGNDIFVFATANNATSDTIADLEVGDIIRVNSTNLTLASIRNNGTSIDIDTNNTAGSYELTIHFSSNISNTLQLAASGTDITFTAAAPSGGGDSGGGGSGGGTLIVNDTTSTNTTGGSRTITNEGGSSGSAAIVQNTGNNGNLVTATLPPAVSITSDGPATAQSGDSAVTTLVTAIQARGSSGETGLVGGATTYLNRLASTTALDIRTIIPTVTSGVTTDDPIVITGSASSGQSEAFVIDMRSITGKTLQVNNIEFVSVIGSATVSGGAGDNFAVGDDSAQFISLGAGNDTLSGGAGNDTIGSADGDDQTYAELQAAATDTDSGVQIALGGGNTLTLNGVTVSQLQSGWFTFG